MGKFFDDEDDDEEMDQILEQISLKHKQFSPRDLNEAEVNTIFARCLADDSDDISITESIQLLKSKFGFTNPDIPVKLNIKKIEANKKNILYLLGQLERTHNYNPLPFEWFRASVKYDNTQWTNSPGNLAKIFYLGQPILATGVFRLIDNQAKTCLLRDSAKPTLSPRDPNFASWWAEHKSEWEDQPE